MCADSDTKTLLLREQAMARRNIEALQHLTRAHQQSEILLDEKTRLLALSAPCALRPASSLWRAERGISADTTG